MAITVTASALVKSAYNFTESSAYTIRSENDSALSNCAYTFGSGNFQINAAVKQTGLLASSGSVMIDLTALSYTTLGTTKIVSMTGIKNVTFTNNATVSGYDLQIRATGTGAMTDIFNGGSGYMVIKPYSSFTYNNPYGVGHRVSGTKKNLTLFNTGPSGTAYTIVILGSLP
jgi:hypothetical protein